MITVRPNVELNGRYTQAETARALEVSRLTVARYEKNGILKFRVRKAGLRKVTTGDQIINCWSKLL